MSERNLDFDTVINRKNTGSLKHDYARQRGKRENLLPLWVADMDFKTSSYIVDAVQKRVEHGIYGYSEPLEGYFDAFHDWISDKFKADIDKKSIVLAPTVVFAMAVAVNAFSKEGESVIIQSPVYPEFRDIIEDNGRKVIVNSLLIDDEFRYQIDFEDFEQKIIENQVKVYLLCNPHNPGGRSWQRDELKKLGDICNRHGVVVVSDEIHADIYFRGHHTMYSAMGEEYKSNSIICTAPTKVFNMPGFQISNIIIDNPVLRLDFKNAFKKTGYSQLNAIGIVAAETAYRYGEKWHKESLAYIKANIEYATAFIERYIPALRVMKMDATYLMWVNFNGLGISNDEQRHLIEDKAGLWLNEGKSFGPEGEGFWRFNLACPRSILEKALEQLKEAVNNK
ncbi:MAG: pyridoxal phosphate-dependent aminotransferase [Butyrivibrio sp.]|nr:pyridoxal phosphate-dependent aminotransferase [Butyrivibrio sp.]